MGDPPLHSDSLFLLPRVLTLSLKLPLTFLPVPLFFPPKRPLFVFFHTFFQNTLCSVFLQISFSQALPKSPSEKLPLHVFSEMSLSQTTTVVRWWCPWPCVHVALSLWRSRHPPLLQDVASSPGWYENTFGPRGV